MQTQLDVVKNHGKAARKIILKEKHLTDFQKQSLEYQKAFDGKLFEDKKRWADWGTQYDPATGQHIPRTNWKPRYIPSIARDLVETHAAYLKGDDKFPEIRATSTTALFPPQPLPEGFEDEPEAGRDRAQGLALQAFVEEICKQAKLQKKVGEAIEQGIIKGEAPLLIRWYGGKPRLTVSDRTWADWEYSETDPDRIIRYTEAYFFTDGRVDENGKPLEYMFTREITEDSWIDLEHPIKLDSHGKEYLGEAVELHKDTHNLGAVPVVIFPFNNGDGIYTGEVLGNVKEHIEWYNDIKTGLYKEMHQQFAVLKDPGDGHLSAAGGSSDEPLKRGELWELEGKSLQAFTAGTDGYTAAGGHLEKEEAQMRKHAHVIDIPTDNEQSGRALLMRLAPQYAAVQDFRSAVGDALVELMEKLLAAALIYAKDMLLPEGVLVPRSVDTITINLDWGQIIPVTPDVVKAELDNVERLVNLRLLSRQTAQEYLLPLMNIEDIPAEQQRLAQEREQEDLEQVQLGNAIMKRLQEKDDEEGGMF